MESRAKQRLTGAVILAALFVLLVPELLTGPKSASEPVAPAEEEGLRSYTIDIDGKTPAAPSATNPVPATVAKPADSGASAAAPTQSPAPVPAPPVAEASPDTTPAPTPESGARVADSSQSAAPASPSAPQASTPVPSAVTKPVVPAQSAPSPAPRGSFVVQLGSFGSRDNADRLVRDMSAKGFKAFVAPIKSSGRELYRVRVGPTRDRASAEALAADLKRAGQSGSIVPIS
jgi:DedD protein